jgi:hypothetical protein
MWGLAAARPAPLIEVNRAKFAGEADDTTAYPAALAAAVEEVCRKQAEIGVAVTD